jgi:nitrogen fixation/metabolism regulation signal transduction histidine kinase
MAARRPSKTRTPLHDRRDKLAEQQETIRQKMEQLNRVIEEAPKIKEERVRAQRDALVAERGRRDFSLHASTIIDPRYDHFPAPSSSRRRPLKAERRQTQIMFLALLVILAVAVLFLLSVWHRQWPG